MNVSLQELNETIDRLESRVRGIAHERGVQLNGSRPTPGDVLARFTPARALPSSAPPSPIPQLVSVGKPTYSSRSIVQLDPSWLDSKCIVAHDGADARSRPYDLMRAQLVQIASSKSWNFVGITSPTAGCGKTTTAINLAMSLARQKDREVILADLDLRAPKIGQELNIPANNVGLIDVLTKHQPLESAVVEVKVGQRALYVLPTSTADDAFSLVESAAVGELLSNIRKTWPSGIVLFNLSPMLTSEEVLSILPQLDCTILVTAVRHSRTSEIEECLQHFHEGNLVRVVVNRATDKGFY